MDGETFTGVLRGLIPVDFPESLVSTMFVFAFLGLRLIDKRILYIALINTVANLIRLSPLAFGMHSVILIIVMAISTGFFVKSRLSSVFLAVLVCFAIQVAAESVYLPLLMKMTGLSQDTIFTSTLLKAAFSLPGDIVILSLSLVLNNFNRKKGFTC